MENGDGVYKRTRSSIKSVTENNIEGQTCLSQNVFVTPNKVKDKSLLEGNSSVKRNKNRNRTPSGHMITNSVGDIRTFFAELSDSSEKKKTKSLKCNTASLGYHNDYTGLSPIVNPANTHQYPRSSAHKDPRASVDPIEIQFPLEQKTSNNKVSQSVKKTPITTGTIDQFPTGETETVCDRLTPSRSKCHIYEDALTHQIPLDTQFTSAEQAVNAPSAETCQLEPKDQRTLYVLKANTTVVTPTSLSSGTTHNNLPVQPSSPNMEIVKDNIDQKLMDLPTVIAMFQSLKSDMSDIKKEVGTGVIDGMKSSIDSNTEAMDSLKKEVKHYKQKSEILAGVVSRMDCEIKDLTQRVQNLELNNMKNSVVLTGFEASKRKVDYMYEVFYFLKDEVKVDVELIDVYPIGMQEIRPLVITVANVQQKRSILQNAKNIKYLMNRHAQPFYFSEYLLAEMNEKKKREKDIIRENYAKEEKDRLEIKHVPGGITIANKRYKKKVIPPSPQEILYMKPEEIEEILNMKLHSGKQSTTGLSTFKAYTYVATTHNEVRRAYLHVKLCNPAARHIICAYNLPGTLSHYMADYCDDAETSAGKRLLSLLQKNDITHRAIFVVRYFGGEKMGSDRYKAILEAAEDAINTSPANIYTKKEQRTKPPSSTGYQFQENRKSSQTENKIRKLVHKGKIQYTKVDREQEHQKQGDNIQYRFSEPLTMR